MSDQNPQSPLLWLYLIYTQDQDITEDSDGGDGPYSTTTSRQYSYTFDGVFRTQPFHHYDYFDISVDKKTHESSKVYAVIVRYSDGDTFNHNSGKATIPAICGSWETANIIKKSIEDDTYLKGQDMYLEWTGYFNSLQYVEVEEFDVQDQLEKDTVLR